ncbi:hypothetical protein ART_2729 [Arthrobacter sp. PAMC 25486]|nr:hypothetical protein ART_2729 [Arthrobacter sp. PAMC 25486]
MPVTAVALTFRKKNNAIRAMSFSPYFTIDPHMSTANEY